MPEAVLSASAPPRETAVVSDLELLIDNFAGGGGAHAG